MLALSILISAEDTFRLKAPATAATASRVRMLPYPDIKDETYRLYQQT
jgi:hypothetical protein